MIPRKRLQVLLYTLQIFYVFGEGDPGNEGWAIDELSDNIIDNSAVTIETPHEYHTILQGTPTMEKEKFSNTSNTMYDSDNRKENDKLDSQTSINTIDSLNLQNSNDNQMVFRHLTIDDLQATSVNISWSSVGDNATTYTIEVFVMEMLNGTYDTKDLHYSIRNLEPCTEYKVDVTPVANTTENNDTISVIFTTLNLKPGKPSLLEATPKRPFSMEIEWDKPIIAGNCIKKYRVEIDTGTHDNRHTATMYTNETKYTFNYLHACSSYMVLVTPIDKEDNDGDFIKIVSLPTFPEVTVAPVLNVSDTKSINTTRNSITLLWQIEDEKNNCSLVSVTSMCYYIGTNGSGFELFNGSNTVNITNGDKPKNVSVTVKYLSPYTKYYCKAEVSNEAGVSPLSSQVQVQTNEDTTSKVQNFKNDGRDVNSKLLFVWEPPKYRPGKILNYRINFTWFPCYPVPDGCKLKRVQIVDNIDPLVTQMILSEEATYAHYYAIIAARTGAGWSQETMIEFDSTLIGGVPDQVTNLTCTISRSKNNSNTLETELSWGLPCASKGLLHYFDIGFTGTRPGYPNHTFTDVVNVTDYVNKNDIFRLSLGELKPVYNYKFEVSAQIHGSIDPGEISDLVITYPSGIPPHPELDYIKSITLDPHKARRTTSSAAILLPLFPTLNGDIKYYAVMVSGVPFDNSSTGSRFDFQNEKWPNVSSWEEAMEKDFKIPYQATEPLWNPFPNYVVDYGHMKAVKFIVGEDTTCPQVSANTPIRAYCNGPLKPDTWYEVRMRAFTDNGYSDSVPFTIKTNAELNVGLVLGVVFGILFLGILTTLMLLVKRCSFRLLLQRILQSNIPESPVPNPYTRRKFLNHCQQLAENPGKLSNEFQLLQTLSVDLQMPSNAACLQANRKKNRYSDILPYDFSRVKLEIVDNDPNTDYINASYIRGYSGNEEYIACQGPKEETTYDFWRMIDQYDVKMILMLTQLVEKGKEKCHQYYPTIRETFNYEKLSIRCTSELDYRTYTQRTFVLQKDDKRRTITHLHFKDWPDHDVPDDFDAMIHFCQIFRKQLATVKGLAVIHCSAGIGRTGTLIAIDILLQSIRDNRKLDVFGTVYRLRRHRLNMVQRESQYAYIYNCIRQVLKNPYFLKSYKPPPIDPVYSNKAKTKKDRSDSSTDFVDSFDTLRKDSLSNSVDSMQPLCQSSPQATPKIQMNVLFAGLRYCKSTSAIDTRSNHNRIGRYNSVGYAICQSTRDSFSTTSKESIDENDLKSSSSSLYENVEPLIQPGSSQTIDENNYYLTNDSVEKDTFL